MTGTVNHSARESLSEANRILVRHGILDAFGHVSVRDPGGEGFLMSCNRAPALVEPTDIQRYDASGEVIDDDRPVYLERFIHSQIYSARPDVNAIVHSHAPAIIPFTVTDFPLVPIMHVAAFLAAGVGRFDLRNERGDGTNLLVTNAADGDALAKSLGAGGMVLMRGHGFVTCAESVELAVFQAVYAHLNATALLHTRGLGAVTELTSAEASAAHRANVSQVRRAWDVWRAGG